MIHIQTHIPPLLFTDGSMPTAGFSSHVIMERSGEKDTKRRAKSEIKLEVILVLCGCFNSHTCHAVLFMHYYLVINLYNAFKIHDSHL